MMWMMKWAESVSISYLGLSTWNRKLTDDELDVGFVVVLKVVIVLEELVFVELTLELGFVLLLLLEVVWVELEEEVGFVLLLELELVLVELNEVDGLVLLLLELL